MQLQDINHKFCSLSVPVFHTCRYCYNHNEKVKSNHWAFIAIVKRDTISDIKDSLGDALGISDDKSLMEELEDLDIDVG